MRRYNFIYYKNNEFLVKDVLHSKNYESACRKADKILKIIDDPAFSIKVTCYAGGDNK